jgi:hypothetical protein
MLCDWSLHEARAVIQAVSSSLLSSSCQATIAAQETLKSWLNQPLLIQQLAAVHNTSSDITIGNSCHRKNFTPIRGDKHGVFTLRRQAAIRSCGCPVVLPHLDFAAALNKDGLDGKRLANLHTDRYTHACQCNNLMVTCSVRTA